MRRTAKATDTAKSDRRSVALVGATLGVLLLLVFAARGVENTRVLLRGSVRSSLEAQEATFFLGLHGGAGEDGTVQELLERRGLAFTGSGSEASRIAFDKLRARERVAARGIPVADAATVTADAVSLTPGP